MLKNLRTIVYYTPNLAAGKEWYIKATGVQPYFDEPFYTGFDINGSELGLSPDTAGTIGGNQATTFWSVDDVTEEAQRLIEIGATMVQDKQDVGGNIFISIVKDPFGNDIGLIQGA